jgi:hypothetical protein
MSSSNNRFGRRTGRQNDDPRFEPVLSFNPKRRGARPAQSEAAPTGDRKPPAGPRVEREDAEEFGISFGDEKRIERDDNFDPRTRREKALEPRDTDSERMLYHHLFDDQANRRRGFGWIAALGSVAVVAIGAGYAWYNFMARPAPGNLFEPPGFATRGNNAGYTTPQQPATDAGTGSNIGSPPAPLAATPPTPTDQPPAKDIAVAPQPKSAPAEAPLPPKKTISEAAANPGNLDAAANPAPAPAAAPPAPPAAKQPAAAPAQIVTPPPVAPPPKRETAKTETPKPETPRKEASITPPRPAPAPAPQNTARQERQDMAPPAVTEPAAAPAITPPPRRPRPQATSQPQSLTRNAPADYAPPPQQQPRQPDSVGPAPGTPDTVTVDGVTYVNGQEPRSLGTLGGASQAASNDAAMPPSLPAMPPPPPSYAARPYTPTDHDGGAPLPNEVIILPSGQMAVPSGQQ